MTEIFIDCNKHGRTYVKELVFTDYIHAECGCEFWFNCGRIENLTERREREKNKKYVDDHKGKRYQDGSRELEGIMLQDGSYI